MSRSKSYSIKLAPQAWKRCGINGTRLFDQQKADKIAYGLYYRQQHGGMAPFSKPIEVVFTFYIKIPKERVRKRPPGSWHYTVPDLDNFAKFQLDTMKQAEVITDDRIVSRMVLEKRYEVDPRVDITITELEDEKKA